MGSGALKFLDKEHGEFKSIRVNDKFRKKGNGSKVINHLINEAKKLNIKKLSLKLVLVNFFCQLENYLSNVALKYANPSLVMRMM